MTSRTSASTRARRRPDQDEPDRPPDPPDAGSSIPARILIVDDDPGSLVAMESLLEGPNRTIVKAESGQAALRCLLRDDFAVILLDVRMPQQDGYETAALIRQRERSRHTPIIFLSGIDTMDADVFRGLTSGAVDYLVKPVVPEILKNKVSVFVDLYRLRERVKQQVLQQSEERFRQLVEGVQDYAIFMLDGEGLVTTWNVGAERLTGYGGVEILGRPYESFYPDEELASGLPARDLQMAAAAETSRDEQDRWMIRKDSTRFIANVVVTRLRDERGGLQGYAVVIRDVTERKEMEDRLRKALKDKESLLREVHHRVKNNLQVISSLLNLQVSLVKDPQIAQLFRECQVRITSIALLHDTLHRSDNLSRIAMSEYMRALIGHLFRSYGVDGTRVQVNLQLDEVEFDIDTGLTCGLILDELVSNCLKHAFNDKRRGCITISLQAHTDDAYSLRVSDDGVGLPKDGVLSNPDSLGLELVGLMAEKLDGAVTVQSGQGTEWQVRFHSLEYQERM
jgi:PAS domain S-box-containing protein